MPTTVVPVCYEVRYKAAEDATRAIEVLDSSMLGGRQIQVTLDPNDFRASIVFVQGVDPRMPAAEVRRHFEAMGPVAFCRGTPDTMFGEVRFKTADGAWQAKTMLDGSELFGKKLRVELDCSTDLLRKILVHGISKRVRWQDLMIHFKVAGEVEFTTIHGGRTATVVFATPAEAEQAMKTLNKSVVPGSGNLGRLHVSRKFDATKQSTEVRVRLLGRISEELLLKHFRQAGEVVSMQIDEFPELPPEFMA